MKINLDRVLQHAETKIQVGPDKNHQEWVTLFNKFLKIEHHRLFMYHRFGASGIEIAEIRSATIDILLRHAYAQMIAHDEKNQSHQAMALIALGGYGRGMLNPHSDIDIMFLVHQKEQSELMIKKLLYLLWDIGLKVGHSVRSPNEAISESKRDLNTCTSIAESRFISGNHALSQDFQKQFFKHCLSQDKEGYVLDKIADLEQRHQKHRNTVYLLEPHIKEGVGGLRDIFLVIWIYYFLYGYKNYYDMTKAGIINAKEYKMMMHALDFMMRTRNELHFLTNKPFDIVTLALQPQIAHNLNIKKERILDPPEAFMKHYYIHARNVHYLTKMLLEKQEVHSQLKLPFKKKYVQRHGFSFTEHEILPGTDPDIFKKNPQKLIEVFLYCVHGNYKISYALLNQIREHLYLVDKKFQSSPDILQLFLKFILHDGAICPTLRMMHECGFIGKYFPEFAAATCFVIHDLYHEFTLDEHTIQALTYLDTFKKSEEPKLARYAEVFQQIQNKDIAFFAIFFHDIGKIKGKNHPHTGAQMAREILCRMRYPDDKAARIALLIEQHLSMAHISQRRNLSEEKVIIEFAKKIVDTENLRILLLLTYADTNATNAKFWNEWKEALLWELYLKTKRYLEDKVPFLLSEMVELENTYMERLTESGISRDTATKHIKMLPFSYLQAFQPDSVAQHIQIISNIKNDDPSFLWHYIEHKNTTVLTICTKDRVGLFSDITGSIAAHHANILSAEIYTRNDSIVIDKFEIVNTHHKDILDIKIRNNISNDLRLVLQKQLSVDSLLKKKLVSSTSKIATKVFPIVQFDTEISTKATVIEIQADDEIGLLYKMSKTLGLLGINICYSKIATEKAQVFDVFYIQDKFSKKITNMSELNLIKMKIMESLNKPLKEFIEMLTP
ncbi:MAG: [protein-PII] uridylyltransferase [Chlamydiota bacterium]|nr:[protein-PII] uridylyltransferase [Chlamydiota bacterium]